MSRVVRCQVAVTLALCLVLSLGIKGSTASASFGFSNLRVSFSGIQAGDPIQAGIHPYSMTTTVEFNTKPFGGGKVVPDEEPRDVIVDLPPGFVGNPDAVPTCANAQFAKVSPSEPFSACPDSSVVGLAEVAASFTAEKSTEELYELNRKGGTSPSPVFNLEPPPGVASKLGFVVLQVPVTIEVMVNPDPPFNLIAEVTNISNVVQVFGSKVTLWGVPADPDHDSERGECATIGGLCEVDLPEVPFLTLPASCDPMITAFKGDSWENRGVWAEPPGVAADDGGKPPLPADPVDCEGLEFDPGIGAEPSNRSASSAAGLDFDLQMDNKGLTEPDGRSEATIEKAVVTLPEGVTANPSAAAGLAGCSPAELERETVQGIPGQGCPEAAKIGGVEVETPVLKDRLVKGDVFIAAPHDNPFDSLLAVYVVIREPELGILLRLAGKIEADPRTGQLVTTFGGSAAELPQLPFSDFRFNLRGGPRGPLITPRTCGTYETAAVLTPSSGNAPEVETATFQIDSGPGGSPCPPEGMPPFEPGFEGGSLGNDAGSFSPFQMRMTRRDGDQDITRFSAMLPPGLVAKIAGTAQCPDAAIAQARVRSVVDGGGVELASPSCPASSLIGRVLAGGGVGSPLTYVSGRVYLAGPYNGAPLSAVAIVPAVAGPFDLGTVVTRFALRPDPRTAQVQIDGSASDPIPHILDGIPLKVRDIRAYVDKPQFMLNPTSCNTFAVGATLWGGGSDPFGSSDDVARSPAVRYQAAGCAALDFAPRLSLRLKGGTERGDFPALRGEYRPRPGDANLEKLVVRLPRSAFLEQGHIRTICTRVQFAADACPRAAIYGQATAFTPLLEQPLAGPVYLRASDHQLPDLVADLRGLIDVEAVARIDSKRRAIRATFTEIPDAPLARVVMEMQGGKKGLIINSTDVCSTQPRARALFVGHNGKQRTSRPVLKAKCGKNRKAR